MNRYEEVPPYTLIAMHDPAWRRGIWFRTSADGTKIELCAGREGDDAYVSIAVDEMVTTEMLTALHDVFTRSAYEVGTVAEEFAARKQVDREHDQKLERKTP